MKMIEKKFVIMNFRITNSDTLDEFATIIKRGNLLVFTEFTDIDNPLKKRLCISILYVK